MWNESFVQFYTLSDYVNRKQNECALSLALALLFPDLVNDKTSFFLCFAKQTDKLIE